MKVSVTGPTNQVTNVEELVRISLLKERVALTELKKLDTQ